MTQIRKQKSDKGWRQRPIGQKPETAETKKVNHLIPFFYITWTFSQEKVQIARD